MSAIYSVQGVHINLEEIAYVSDNGHIAFRSTQMLHQTIDRSYVSSLVEAWKKFKDKE